MGNDSLLADVGAQNVSDPDLAQHANQFVGGLQDHSHFDKSADLPQQNFGLFEGVDHGMYEDEIHAVDGLNDAQDYLAIQPSPQGDVMKEDSDDPMQDG